MKQLFKFRVMPMLIMLLISTSCWAQSTTLETRYIRSDLSGGIGTNTHVPGNAFSSDVSFFYNRDVSQSEQKRMLSWGINLSDIG